MERTFVQEDSNGETQNKGTLRQLEKLAQGSCLKEGIRSEAQIRN
jgi:hypothetical protein